MKKRKQLLCMLLGVSVLVSAGCSRAGTPSDAGASSESEHTGGGNVGKAAVSAGEFGTATQYNIDEAHYALDIDASEEVHDISDMLYGIFIEDINFAADGGLYAEMVQNRSFEFNQLASDDQEHAWVDVGEITSTVVQEADGGQDNGEASAGGCLNANNPNYMVLENASSSPAGIANIGWLDGMSIVKDANYKCSVYVKGMDGYTGPVHISLMNGDQAAAEADIDAVTAEWKKYEVALTSSETANQNVRLQVTIDTGKAAVDMVSMFPEDTYKGRENGLRRDLAEKLEELKPAFLRFPGGCVVEGVNLACAYDWKNSIGCDENGQPFLFNDTYGDVAARKQDINIWTDERATEDKYPAFMSYGLGFYEYFLLAEDIGAVGVPVINAGMCCMAQGSGTGPELSSEEFKKYVQDALDLVEFCRGGSDTKWGAVRTAMGHEEPFALKYIGIGNEQWGRNFFSRYDAFVDAFNEAKKENPELYGDIELMFTAGLDDGDSGPEYIKAYVKAANWLKAHPDQSIEDFAGAIDHHYYNSPSWFLTHTDYYDEENYSRDVESMASTKFGGGMNVFLGEYAAQSNRLEAALAEAAYMTGLERNGDIVKMAAYAPLFGNTTATHWAPDLIWFNNNTVTCSTNYYIQKIFGTNAGTELLKSEMDGVQAKSEPLSGKVGLGTWSTSATFDNVKIVNNDTGETIAEDDFSKDTMSDWEKVSDGNWSIDDGQLVQSSTADTAFANTGSVLYFGDQDWNNYTFTVDATKTGGAEGFLIPFAVQDKDNNYFWNIGGWGNTSSCLQQVTGGTKSDQIAGTETSYSLKNGVTYTLKVEVNDTNVKCYIDDKLYVDYNVGEENGFENYHVVSTDETGDIIIKLVNETGEDKTFGIQIEGADKIQDTAAVDIVAGNSLADDNILGQEEAVTLKSGEVTGISEKFNYTVPKYSVTVLRVKN